MTACGEASPLVYHLKGSPDLSTSQNCMENPENFDASRYTVFMNFSDVDLDVSNMKTPLQRNITAGPLVNFENSKTHEELVVLRPMRLMTENGWVTTSYDIEDNIRIQNSSIRYLSLLPVSYNVFSIGNLTGI